MYGRVRETIFVVTRISKGRQNSRIHRNKKRTDVTPTIVWPCTFRIRVFYIRVFVRLNLNRRFELNYYCYFDFCEKHIKKNGMQPKIDNN